MYNQLTIQEPSSKILSENTSVAVPTLLPQHAALLSAIKPEIVVERGYYSETSPLALQVLGIAPELSAALVPALVAPVTARDVYPRQKRLAVHIPASLNQPDHWLLPDDLPTCVDLYPDFHARDFQKQPQLIVTDRVDVADLFSSRGYMANALLAPERWRGGGGNGPELMQGLRWARNRSVYLAFNCEVQTSKAHRKMMRCLTKQLVNFVRSCTLFEMRVPPTAGGERLSYNDYFLRGGTVEHLVEGSELIGKPVFKKPTTSS